MNEIIEKVWDGWKVVRKIGSGGFSSVYEIQRNVFGKTESAALKVISIPQNLDETNEYYSEGYSEEKIKQHYAQQMEELVNEYSIMLDMKGYTNIVYCDDLRYVKHSDGIGWYVFIKMELLTPLLKVWSGGFSESDIIRLGIDICNALVICKKKNILHRDIKPQNIFVSENGDFKLGDFGVAKVSENSQSGTKIGTLDYMSPEVFSGKPYGDSTDLYSLGIMLYFFLNKKHPPFVSPSDRIISAGERTGAALKRLSGAKLPPPLCGTDSLKQIVLKACAFEPSQRYSSAEEMLNALKTLEKNENSNILQSETAVTDNYDDSLTVGRFDIMPEAEMDFDDDFEPDDDIEPEDMLSPEVVSEPSENIKIGEEIPDNSYSEKEQETERVSEKPKKKSKGRKLLAALLVFVGIISVISFSVYFIVTKTSCDHLQYVLLDDGTYSVNGTSDCKHHKIEIPSEYEGRPVTAISEKGFIDHGSLCEVVIPDSITVINANAFGSCDKLWKIELPETVKYIGDNAFANCASIAEIYIPEKVSYLGASAFSNCSSLKSIYIPEKITEIKENTFKNCVSLESVSATIEVTKIGEYAFANCKALAHIENLIDVETIGDFAFSECVSLTEFDCPTSLSEIPNGMFYGCSSLERIVVRNSVEKIGATAFYGCNSLSSVTLSRNLREIGDNAFELCTSLTSIYIPKSVKTMGARVFYACNRLETINCSDIYSEPYGWVDNWIGNDNSVVKWRSS